jgi:hypothetical protein
MQQSLEYAQVGPIASTGSLAQGSQVPFRLGNMGDQIASPLHGKHYEQTYQGRMFACSNQAAVTTTAALATTFTGLAIANPAGSGFNLVMNRFTCAQFAVGAAAAVGIMTGSGAAAGSLTARNRKTGSTITSVATASAGATIATPVLEQVFGSVGSLATTGYGLTPALNVDLEGSLIVPPGFYVASFTSIVTTSALIFGFMWEEVPI